MTHEELEQKVQKLVAQNLILRDYVVWLMVREIHGSLEPQNLLRAASDFVDAKIDSRAPQNENDLTAAEMLRKEKDWIVSAIAKSLENLATKNR